MENSRAGPLRYRRSRRRLRCSTGIPEEDIKLQRGNTRRMYQRNLVRRVTFSKYLFLGVFS